MGVVEFKILMRRFEFEVVYKLEKFFKIRFLVYFVEVGFRLLVYFFEGLIISRYVRG